MMGPGPCMSQTMARSAKPLLEYQDLALAPARSQKVECFILFIQQVQNQWVSLMLKPVWFQAHGHWSTQPIISVAASMEQNSKLHPEKE